MGLYTSVSTGEIADSISHLRELFRTRPPKTAEEERAHERRELTSRYLLSNLWRMKAHPTLNTLVGVANSFSLTMEGAHRLFGYNLNEIRKFDLLLNSGRTRIIESYPFETDLHVQVPLDLGTEQAFHADASLRDMVERWQSSIPIRSLTDETWHTPGVFYVQVGTEDSLGSSLPPGSIAMVEPIGDVERMRPSPRSVYLLQFGNGYRCSRCLVTKGKLILLTSMRGYSGVHEFAYPREVRIAGRIRMFASSLPVPESSLIDTLPESSRVAPLVLPWEHTSVGNLFAAKYQRFVRSKDERSRIRTLMDSVFSTKLSERTERRYRGKTYSQPHLDSLIRLSVSNAARYSDSLRAQKALFSESGRFSLATLLQAKTLHELMQEASTAEPLPREQWLALRRQYVEWPMLLSLKFPELQSMQHRVVRLSEAKAVEGLDPPLSSGSLLLLDKVAAPQEEARRQGAMGWSRPLYAIRRGAEIVCGYLEQSADTFALITDRRARNATTIGGDELSRVVGAAIPV